MDDSIPTFSKSVGALIASLRPDRALSPLPLDLPRELFKDQCVFSRQSGAYTSSALQTDRSECGTPPIIRFSSLEPRLHAGLFGCNFKCQ